MKSFIGSPLWPAIVCYLLFTSNNMMAIVFGSDTVVSRQGNVTFPAADNNNTMLGFAFFTSGFNLEDSTTSCTFNDFFPVTGSVTLNGGTLNLLEDLTFLDGVQISAYGVFNAQFNSIFFQQANKLYIPANPNQPTAVIIFKNVQMLFSSPVYLNWSLRFQGTNIIEVQDNIFEMGPYGSIIVDSNSSLFIRNATLGNITGTKISCTDNTGVLTLDGVKWEQSSDVVFNNGVLAIAGDTLMTGTSKFIYSSPKTCTVSSKATWMFDSGMTLSYCPGANNLLKFEDATSTLYLYETRLYVPAPGLWLTKGTLTIEGMCPFINDATSAVNGIWIGDGTAGNDMKLNVLSDSGISASKGYIVYKNLS